MRWAWEKGGEGDGGGVDMWQVAGSPGPVSLWLLEGMPRGSCDFFLFAGSVFQLTHDVYKPFIFATETLSDLSM